MHQERHRRCQHALLLVFHRTVYKPWRRTLTRADLCQKKKKEKKKDKEKERKKETLRSDPRGGKWFMDVTRTCARDAESSLAWLPVWHWSLHSASNEMSAWQLLRRGCWRWFKSLSVWIFIFLLIYFWATSNTLDSFYFYFFPPQHHNGFLLLL